MTAAVTAPRLFAILVGGKHARGVIELHDVFFVVAPSIEEAVPALRQLWWGTPSSLHIDAYAELDVIDGHKVTPIPRENASANGAALFFVNTGGYQPGVFNELHAFSFHVGTDKRAIWAQARARADFTQQHQDNFEIVDDVIAIDDALAAQHYALALTPTDAPDRIDITAKYIKLQSA